jgi:hypothetical protein
MDLHTDLPTCPTDWRKSSFSGAQGQCVELAVRPRVTGIRDTKRRDAGALVLPDAARAALLAFVR